MRVSMHGALTDVRVLADLFEGELHFYGSPCPLTGIATCSAEILPGDAFLALPGSRQMGWDFARDALARGAACIIAPSHAELPSGVYAIIAVKDSAAALLRAAANWRRSFSGRVIAISGSAGKTTLKEGLAAVLREEHSVSISEGNFNSTVGMPLSVLGMSPTEYHILELGINRPGEMEPMSRVLAPDIAVLTNVGSAHIGGFSGYEELLLEKCKLLAGLAENGCAFLPFGLNLPPIYYEKNNIFTVGAGMNCDFCAENIRMDATGVHLNISGGGRIVKELSWHIPGAPGVGFLSMCAALSLHLGISDAALHKGLARAAEISPRMHRVLLGNRLLLSDTYNASPESMAGALEALCLLAQGRPCIAVLGDMAELGSHSETLHEAVGECVAKCGITQLFTYGEQARGYVSGALLGGMNAAHIHCFSVGEERELAAAVLCKADRNACILVKGARKMKTERLTEWMERMASCRE